MLFFCDFTKILVLRSATIGTEADEFKTMSKNAMLCQVSHGIFQIDQRILNGFHRRILNAPAAHACNVIVVMRVRVKTHLGKIRFDFPDEPGGSQDIKIPVHGSQAYPRKTLTNAEVEFISRWV
jgi:hypothetical protein